MRSGKRWRSALAATALTVLAACAPRGAEPPVLRPVPPAAPPAAPPVVDPGVEVLPERAEPTVRVGLVVDTSAVEVTSDDGFVVRTEEGRQVAVLPAGATARFTDAGGGATLQVVAPGGGATGETIRGLPLPLVVRPGEGLLRLRGAPYRGDLVVQAAPRGGLTLVNRLDLETYLLGVVPREIGKVGPELLEAAKAQAVAARTYAVRYLGRRSELGFDVYATVQDQVYGGVAAEHEPVSRAVRETEGEILTFDGRPITAYYHSTCAGRTAAIEEVWNERPVPYLVSVVDVNPATGEAFDVASSRFRWTERWSHDELVRTLNRTLADSLRGRRITRIRDIDVVERTPSGRVRRAVIETDAGRFTVGKDRIRWILTPTRGGILNSAKFDVRLVRQGDRVVEIVAEGGGWGHGIGMCQVGAMGRARAGQSYATILQTYYPGTDLVDLY